MQHATAADGGTVAGAVLDQLRRLNAGAEPLGSFGAVVGATIGDTDGAPRHQRPAARARVRRPGRHRRRPPRGSSAPPPPRARQLVARAAAARPRPRRAARRRSAGPTTTSRRPSDEAARRVAALAVAGARAAGVQRQREDVREDYCEAVKDHQDELSELHGRGGPDTRSCGRSRSSASSGRGARATSSDEWQQVARRARRPRRGPRRRRASTPRRTTRNAARGRHEDQQQAIARAADELATQETVAAGGLEQHALDVCKTPLYRERQPRPSRPTSPRSQPGRRRSGDAQVASSSGAGSWSSSASHR